MVNVAPNGVAAPGPVYPNANVAPTTTVNVTPNIANSGDNKGADAVAPSLDPKIEPSGARSVERRNYVLDKRSKKSKNTWMKSFRELDATLTDFRLGTAKQSLEAERIWLSGSLEAEHLKQEAAALLRIEEEAFRKAKLALQKEQARKDAAEREEVAAHEKAGGRQDEVDAQEEVDYEKAADRQGDSDRYEEKGYQKTSDRKGDSNREEQFNYDKGQDRQGDADRHEEYQYNLEAGRKNKSGGKQKRHDGHDDCDHKA